MTIIDQIKKLRADTSAGVMEVKKALSESGGNTEKAKKLLQEWGVAKAAKKSERQSSEGLVATYVHVTGKIASMIELFCETDFVARTEDFKNLSRELAMQVAATNPKGNDELLSQAYIRESNKTVQDLINKVIAKVGENIRIGKFVRFQI